MILQAALGMLIASHMAYSGMIVSHTPWTGTQYGVFEDWVDGRSFELRVYIPDGMQLESRDPYVALVYQHQFAGRSLVLVQGLGSFVLHPSDPGWRDFKRDDREGDPNQMRLVSVVPSGDWMIVKIEWINP